MSVEITIEMLKKSSISIGKKYSRQDLSDDLLQELWFDIDHLKETYDPSKGAVQSLIHKHAEYKIRTMMGSDNFVYVDDIVSVSNQNYDVSEEHDESSELEDRIDKHAALDKIRQKLKNKGCSSNLKVVKTYKEKLEGRKERKKSKGRYDSADRKKLVRLQVASGVSQSRFAKALGLSPQRYQSYIDGTVQNIPSTIIDLAEKTVVSKRPEPLTSEEMIAWCAELLKKVPLEDVSQRRKEEYLSNIVNVSRVTITRWRLGQTRLMPAKARGLELKIVDYISSVS